MLTFLPTQMGDVLGSVEDMHSNAYHATSQSLDQEESITALTEPFTHKNVGFNTQAGPG